MNSLVQVNNNKKYGLVTTSRMVADGLEKRHDHVLRDLDKILENPNMGSLIIPTTYKVKGQKREYKEYLLTKDGFTLYMFNIQGYNDFKMAYINEFNRMEQILNIEKLKIEPYRIEKKTYKRDPVMVVKDIVYLTGNDRSTINTYIKDNNLGTLLEGVSLDKFKYENSNYLGVTKSLNILYRDDVIDILTYFYKYKDNKEIVDKYYDILTDASEVRNFEVFTKLVFLGMLKNAIGMYSLNDKMRKEFNYIISKEYIKLGFADNTMDNFDMHTKEGLELLAKMGRWTTNIKRM